MITLAYWLTAKVAYIITIRLWGGEPAHPGYRYIWWRLCDMWQSCGGGVYGCGTCRACRGLPTAGTIEEL